MRACRTCGISKPLGSYPAHNQFLDGIDTRCRECKAKYMREWKARKTPPVALTPLVPDYEDLDLRVDFTPSERAYIEKCRAGNPALQDRSHKTCNTCKESLPRHRFHMDRSVKDGLARACRDCHKIHKTKTKTPQVAASGVS